MMFRESREVGAFDALMPWSLGMFLKNSSPPPFVPKEVFFSLFGPSKKKIYLYRCIFNHFKKSVIIGIKKSNQKRKHQTESDISATHTHTACRAMAPKQFYSVLLCASFSSRVSSSSVKRVNLTASWKMGLLLLLLLLLLARLSHTHGSNA